MIMADCGMGLWSSGYAETEPIENDNMSIDLDSFMELLNEEPHHPQINLEDSSSSDFSIKDSYPGAVIAEATEPGVKKLQACTGNYTSIGNENRSVGVPESSRCKQIGMEVNIPVKTEASVESSLSHYSGSTFGEQLSSFTNCRSFPINCNGRYQYFHLDKEMPAGIKKEGEHHFLGVHKEERKIDRDSYVRGCHPDNSSIQNEICVTWIHQDGTSILHHVPAAVHEQKVEEKNTKVGMGIAYNRYHHSDSICSEDTEPSTLIQPNVTATFSSNFSPESTQSNSVTSRFQVDDEPDICIIEVMSHPAPSNRYIIPGKSLIPPKPCTLYDSRHQFGLEGSFKPKQEQSIVQEVSALQNVSQQRPELDPPNGTLAVPLLRHQVRDTFIPLNILSLAYFLTLS